MSFLLDTNVVSEWVKPRPDPGVVAWLSDADEDRLYLSVMTLAELRRGVERLADGARRKRLDAWLSHDLALRFEGRILPIVDSVADVWGKITARREAAGMPISVVDAFIAATAEVHGLALITRNTSDFKTSVKTMINPWTT
ncbi:MAG: type II toxin-antitoxin system VapC family toxin [Alphaproteobacteria bacterium]|nr:type II toxin-antitoxin system VapC family toxin [Alphaproteobacteria bacterium]MDE2111675.1 type II toxin-antitoxin system VapC family toxin [Alphaproteobacteria bacterium]MDE2492831.1 type II toxin-antitoxin system VapC family toxin [Alphaproteobacteria bacterium]